MTRIFLLVVTGVLLLFVSCSPADIRIGAFLPLTGPTSAYGISAANAMKLAVDEVNQSGDFIGFDLEIEDDQSKTENVANVVNHLITDRKVQALLAEPVSTRAMVAAPIAQQNQIVMISSSSVKPELTMQGNYIFRACFVSSRDSADVRNALAATKNFIGVTGMITLDENRNAQVPVYILRIEGGKFTLQQ